MTEEEYQDHLKLAPTDHLTKEFILFLVNNNKVIYLSENWLVIENIKYWTPENDWLTAFYLPITETWGGDIYQRAYLEKLKELENEDDLKNREWLIKAPSKRTIKLFHVHMYKK